MFCFQLRPLRGRGHFCVANIASRGYNRDQPVPFGGRVSSTTVFAVIAVAAIVMAVGFSLGGS